MSIYLVFANFICSYNSHSSVAYFHFAAQGQQIPIQQDPSDPSKWQVVATGTTQTATPLNIPTLMSPLSQVSNDTPTSGKRLRRVACTCPNCQNNENK